MRRRLEFRNFERVVPAADPKQRREEVRAPASSIRRGSCPSRKAGQRLCRVVVVRPWACPCRTRPTAFKLGMMRLDMLWCLCYGVHGDEPYAVPSTSWINDVKGGDREFLVHSTIFLCTLFCQAAYAHRLRRAAHSGPQHVSVEEPPQRGVPEDHDVPAALHDVQRSWRIRKCILQGLLVAGLVWMGQLATVERFVGRHMVGMEPEGRTPDRTLQGEAQPGIVNATAPPKEPHNRTPSPLLEVPPLKMAK